MRSALRWAGYLAGGVIVIAAVLAAYIWIASNRMLNGPFAAKHENLSGATPEMVADASRRLHVFGCISCHGDGMRGSLFIDDPHLAKLYAPNVSEIAGKATDQQLAAAIRQGIGVDGRALAIMPSAQFSRLTDGEVAALIAAVRKLPSGGAPTPARTIGAMGRLGVATGKFRTQPQLMADYVQQWPADLGPNYAKGRHLAATVCSECHGPALDGAEVKPGLKSPDLDIVGAYDLAAFTKLLRTGIPASGKKLTLMDEVARANFSHMTDEEIAELHAYLVGRAQRSN
ncbi:cytochrome c [Sphingomonas alba]|uniref:Cytochrome c n=1 Tax=Sphingomonas alba TaxID=2908208 RepID=A0ABT0RP03_9SPHN|nr:cytochrome c [Sphingomonas alba]MCL6684372.1 cytochrome c [Sphingomonas alba]